jgi:hypothetical protein
MMETEIILERKEGRPDWIFKWDNEFFSYVHKTKHRNIYKIFFDIGSISLDVWIGRRIKHGDHFVWVTIEREIKAAGFWAGRVYIKFN